MMQRIHVGNQFNTAAGTALLKIQPSKKLLNNSRYNAIIYRYIYVIRGGGLIVTQGAPKWCGP